MYALARSLIWLLHLRLTIATAVVLAGLGLIACSTPSDPPYSALPPHLAWKSIKPFGTWKNAGFVVFNNEWNTSQAGPQTIWASSFQHWGVRSKQPVSTSVKTYPCVQMNYKDPPITSFVELSSTFMQSMPATTDFDAEAAYDIWLNRYKAEVMIWVDNNGQTPAGDVITYAEIQNQRFAVWQGGPTMYSFVLAGRQETKGKVDLLSFLNWLLRHDLLSKSDTVTQVNFGWEIASTDGVPLDFSMNRYSLSTTLAS